MLEKIKRFPLVRIFYKFPGLALLYHLLLAFFGALFYGFPSKRIFVVGVTGTKGKTTVLELLDAILEASGKKTALLSSLREKIGEKTEKNKSGNTMPGRFYIQRFLFRAAKAGCKYALVEVTSQGVALHRHRFINWNAGILTNIASEHIEAHGSFEKYRGAKLNFLRYVASRRGRIFLNKEDKNGVYFAEKLARFSPVLYSRKDENILHAMPSELPLRGAIDERTFIWSDFNRDNAAAAIAAALDLGIDIKTIERALRNFLGVPGRMEFVRRGGITAVVDYAHTPDSLKKVYAFLRERIANRESHSVNSKSDLRFAPSAKLICALGSAGGGRDKWKRPEMGKIAAEYCDEIILTNEDPYDEKPETIIEEIASGFSQIANRKSQRVHKILDRKEAIFKAVELMREGDIVVCTGKGTEDWIHLAKGEKIPWNERQALEEALNEKK